MRIAVPNTGEYVPTIGENVLLQNHLGVFVIEGINADAKTASLRVLRSGVLLNDVEWRIIRPLDDRTRALLREILKSEGFERIRFRHTKSDDSGG